MGDLRDCASTNESDFADDLAALQADSLRVPQGWLGDKGPPPLINPSAIATDEALARAAKCYLDNAILCLNEAVQRGLKVSVELDTETINRAGGRVERAFKAIDFHISKDLLK